MKKWAPEAKEKKLYVSRSDHDTKLHEFTLQMFIELPDVVWLLKED